MRLKDELRIPMIFKGKVHRFGNNLNTDEIIAAKYLNITDEKELGKHCMESINKNFVAMVSPSDIIVAGKNFGCGSSREHAPLAIKGCGISCVIAKSFARIFYRNAINIGLPILECVEVTDIKEGDVLKVELDKGKIDNLTKKKSYVTAPFPKFMQGIVNAGGLLNWIKKDV